MNMNKNQLKTEKLKIMKKLFVMAGVACMFLASCSKDDLSPVSTTGKSELGVTASVVQTGTSTRSVVSGTSFPNLSAINVFVNGTGYTTPTAVTTYSCDGNKWTPNASNKIYLNNQTATVYGYYPSSAVVVGTLDANATISTSLLQQGNGAAGVNSSLTGDNQDDYMYATGEQKGGIYSLATISNNGATDGGNTVSLSFHHALTKISFIINKGTYNGTGTVTKLELSTNSGSTPAVFYAGNGTMKVSDGTLVWTDSKVSSLVFQSSTGKLINSSSTSTDVVVTGLVAPTDVSNPITDVVTLKITIDGKEMSVTLPKNDTTNNAISWLPGNDYQYSVTVNGAELLVNNSVKLVDWTTTSIAVPDPIY